MTTLEVAEGCLAGACGFDGEMFGKTLGPGVEVKTPEIRPSPSACRGHLLRSHETRNSTKEAGQKHGRAPFQRFASLK